MNKSLLVILSLGLFLGSQEAQALTKKQVAARTITFAAFCAVPAYVWPFWQKQISPVLPFNLKKCEGTGDEGNDNAAFFTSKRLSVKEDAKCPLISAGVAAGVGGWLSLWFCKQFTPKARYKWATNELAKLNPQLLFMNEVGEDTIAWMLRKSGCQSHELPLVKMFLELQKYDKKLTYMIDELRRAIEDAGVSSRLALRLTSLIVQIIDHQERIRKSEACVQAQDKWLDQWRLHQERELYRERIYATQTHAHAHLVYNL